MKLSSKVSIITGAGSGIGRTTALRFAEEGSRVIVADIDTTTGSETVDMITSKGGDALFVHTDVTDSRSIQDMVKNTTTTYGALHVLVNVAGIFTEGTVVNTAEAVWKKILDVNLLGMFLSMKYCIPEMITSGGGAIVNIASEAGLVGIKNQVAYNVSKSGVIALSKSTAVDFAQQNIRVNCICPGRVLTPLVEKVISESSDPDQKRKVLSEDRPLMRMGKPEEIANAVLYLCTDEAAYAIGTVLCIDGGYTAV